MGTEVREFPLSGAYLARRQKGMAAGFACFPIMAVAVPYVMSLDPECTLSARFLWLLGAGTAVFGLCLGAGMVWTIGRTWRQLRAQVHEDRLVSLWGRGEFAIPWAEVTGITKHELPTGEIMRLDVTPASGRTIWLTGLEDMEGLLEAIRRKAPEGLEVQVKHHRVDWSTPVANLVLSLVSCVVICGLLTHERGLNAYLVVIYLGSGGYLLIAKPISHTRPRWRRLEVGVAWFLLLGGTAMAVAFVLLRHHGG